MEIDMLKNPHPSHPGAILSEVYLSQLGWSQTKLAEKLGCAHRKVNEIINGKRSISPDFALDLEKALSTEAEMWVRLQAEFDLYQARKKREAA
jgi:addiction module HigA family antidote